MKIAVHTPASIESLVADPFAGRQLPDVRTKTLPELPAFTVGELEEKLLAVDQVDCPVVHRFGPGVYIREVTIPAGTLVIGHLHTTEHLNVLLKGRILLLNEDSTTTAEMVAPFVYTAKPGRKVAFAKEEVVWQNIYATTETDVETIEAMFMDKSEIWLEDSDVRMKAATVRHAADRSDYLQAIAEYGFTPEQVWEISANAEDQVPMPLGSYTMMIGQSAIHGKGVLATATIASGEIVGPARIGGKRTPIGRYTNHSVSPNAVMVKHVNGDIDLVAIRAIPGCQGGQPGDEITVDYRQVMDLTRTRS